MAFQVTAEFTGLQEVFDRLASLDAKIGKKIARDAVNEASKALLKSAKAYVPVEVGVDALSRARSKQLKKSLGRKIKTYRRNGTIVGIIGPRRGFKIQVGVRTRGKNIGQPVFYDPVNTAHLVELGTHRSAAKPFLRPALDSTPVAAIMKTRILEGIEREAKNRV